jgi:GTP-binding protein
MPPRVPVVAIVGRQNVGKSSLFNRLCGRRIAIVDARPGTTLDRIEKQIEWEGRAVRIVDTGGLGADDADPYGGAVERQVAYALDRADAVIFLCDVTGGITAVELELARRLRGSERPVLLGVNKVDHERRRPDAEEFRRLGFGDPIPLSVTANRGIDDLLDAVIARLPSSEAPPAEGPAPRLAIVGKPNAGKSTLVNALCGEDRVVVSERPGTTRDAVDVEIVRGGRRLVLVDTAGFKRRGRAGTSVEFFSQARAREAIRGADGVVFLLEAVRALTALERHLGDAIRDAGKPFVMALNKWDLVPAGERKAEKFVRYVREAFPEMAYAPVRLLSAKLGSGVDEAVDAALDLIEVSRIRVGTGELNRALRVAIQGAPNPVRGTKEGRLLYATQTAVAPPTIVVFVKHKAAFTGAYLRHLERSLRRALPFAEVPLRILLREVKRKKKR